jgi:hypothetical protein
MADEGNRALAEVVAEQVATPIVRKRERSLIRLGVAGVLIVILTQLASMITRSFPWWIAVPWFLSLIMMGLGAAIWSGRLRAWIGKNLLR